MLLLIGKTGNVACLYNETITLPEIGPLSIRRGSFVEPDGSGNWFADLAPVSGPILGPFRSRSKALQAERLWLEKNWLPTATVG